MKRIFFLVALIFVAGFSNAQVVKVNGYVKYGPLLNLANSIPKATVDTLTDAGTLDLTIASWMTNGLPDTMGIYTEGKMSFHLVGHKISGTPAAVAHLQQSIDGIVWGDVPVTPAQIATVVTGSVTATYTYTTPYVFTLTNVTTNTIICNLPVITAPFLRWHIVGAGTESVSFTSQWFLKSEVN